MTSSWVLWRGVCRKRIINDARVGEMLLIKGSHATGIYKIIDYIKGGKND